MNSSLTRRKTGLPAATFGMALTALLALSAVQASAQSANDSDNNFDLKSSVGDVHLGSDVNQHELGLPTYPGARLRKHDQDRSNANLALFTSAFGVKLLVANYESDDEAAKVVEFYRGKLKKYGKVLECHSSRHGGNNRSGIDVDEQDGDSARKSKELKCDGDNTGEVIELKVGTEDDQHAVAVEPAEKGKGSTFEIVYVHTRGKQGEI